MTMKGATIQRVTTPAGDPAWRVTGYDPVKQLLGDPRLGPSHPDPDRASRFSESPIGGRPSRARPTDAADHARLRRLLNPAFGARRMAQLRPHVQELVDGLLDELSRGPQLADLHRALCYPLPALVICHLLGVPHEDRDGFRTWSEDAGDMVDGARARAGMERLRGYMGQLVERRRREPSEGVISDLIAAQPGDPWLTEERLIEIAVRLLFGGYETTVAAIDRGVLLVLTDRAQREAIERDLALVPRAVEEILRHPGLLPADGPIGTDGVPRWASADIDLDGVTIEAGDLVLLVVSEANLDEHRFPMPHAFDVSREPNPHVAFGHGPHFCVGAPLARLELQVVFGTLLGRFPNLRLALPVEELRPRSGHLTSVLEELPVTW